MALALGRVLALARRAVREARELAQAVPGRALVPGLRAARVCAGLVAAVLVVLGRVLALARRAALAARALAQAVPARAQVAEALPAG